MVFRKLKKGDKIIRWTYHMTDIVCPPTLTLKGIAPGEKVNFFENRSYTIKNILSQTINPEGSSKGATLDISFIDSDGKTQTFENVHVLLEGTLDREPFVEGISIVDGLKKYYKPESNTYEIPVEKAVGSVAEEILARVSCSRTLIFNNWVEKGTYILVNNNNVY